MRRFQLFEFLDQPWCPRVIRDGATDCLEAIVGASDVYRPIRSAFAAAIAASGSNQIVDLCSGGGGPWLSRSWQELLRNLNATVTLTDKFPSHALESRLTSCDRASADPAPIDAAAVLGRLSGFRTIFSSFHHFPDRTAVRVLEDAVTAGEGFASAEVTARTLYAICFMFLMPVLVWAVTPRMRPFRWSRLLLTYLLPAIPFVVWWDGVISCLRTRTPAELLALACQFPSYDWQAGYGKVKFARLAPVYLIGTKRSDHRTES